MSRAKAVVTGLKQQLIIGLAPAIEASAVTWKYFVEEMKQHNITKEDIMEAMRIEAKIKELSKVKEVYLERNGRISCIPS